ncbi:Heme oxygenase-like, multi-helical [Tolypocladium paradoxum]|uniref:Heme oxygenase-like, multi-helical n=1 Tax=Tolypocladium paradoxum TaxID=94208 RepID=A0A2S4L1M3_9HYPO|nr:Heme oxygenase-like, multi-helical [Tolypocladium paradoxum]
MARFHLTRALIDSDADGFRKATQSAFLSNAARGKVPKDVLGQWLANDRLYIHGYIQGIGRMLSFLSLPETVPQVLDDDRETSTRLLAWLIDALVNIRREERFFVDTAAAFDISVNLETQADGTVPASAKLEGLRRFEALFAGLGPGDGTVLPWLECAVVFYGTEKCYLDAWSFAKKQLDDKDGGGDADGGALRNEFIPNWTSEEFVEFVVELGDIIDEAVQEQIEAHGERVKAEIVERSLVKWRALLAAEQAFWPAMKFIHSKNVDGKAANYTHGPVEMGVGNLGIKPPKCSGKAILDHAIRTPSPSPSSWRCSQYPGLSGGMCSRRVRTRASTMLAVLYPILYFRVPASTPSGLLACGTTQTLANVVILDSQMLTKGQRSWPSGQPDRRLVLIQPTLVAWYDTRRRLTCSPPRQRPL